MHFSYLFFLFSILFLQLFESDCRTPLTKWELGDPPVDMVTWMCVKRLRAAKAWNRIMSPGYPRTVDTKNTRCSWKIQAPGKKRVRLTFKSMSLRSSDPDGCPDNYVLVIDENIGRYQQRLCGKSLPDDIVSSKNTIRIDFQIDMSNIADSKGFLINFKYTNEKSGFYDRNPPEQEEENDEPMTVSVLKEPKRLNRYNKPLDDDDGVNYVTIIIIALIIIVAIIVICWVVRRKKKEKKVKEKSVEKEEENVKDPIPPPPQNQIELPMAAPPPYEQIQEEIHEPVRKPIRKPIHEPIHEPVYANFLPNSEPPLPPPRPLEKPPIEPPTPVYQQQPARKRRSHHRRSNTAPSRHRKSKRRRASFYEYEERPIRDWTENITSDRMLYPTSRPSISRLASQNPAGKSAYKSRTANARPFSSVRQKSGRSTVGRGYKGSYESNDDPRRHRQHRLPSQMSSHYDQQQRGTYDQQGGRPQQRGHNDAKDKIAASRSQAVQWNT